jgi:tripartite ATP-independent transporter DctP family solute receptor
MFYILFFKEEIFMETRKVLAVLAGLACLLAAWAMPAGAAPAKEVVLKLGFENSMSEPISQGFQKWADLVAERGDGSIKIVLYPDSQLGSKNSLIDAMLLGDTAVTLADGAFYADYGVKDFGIVFGPFLFNNWDECWKLQASDWYREQEKALEAKGLKLLGSNWVYGARHTLTVKPVRTVGDLAGQKIRVPSNQIQTIGFNVLGATATGMALGDVYTALQAGTIDGAENPLATLYGRKLQEVAKYLILDGHVLNFTTLVCSAELFNSFTKEQQELLVSACRDAGVYNNQLQQASEAGYLQKMKDEGVTVYDPSEADLKTFRDKAQAFYSQGATFGWSAGLYEKVKAALGR